jgi:hypothetical protein
MNYTINYLKNKHLVQVEIRGRVYFSMVRQYSIEAIKLAREYNCKKFLINHTKTLLEAGVNKLHMGEYNLEQYGFDSNDMIAIVIPSNKKDSQLFEPSDTNVKWSNFKYFNTIDKAVGWLVGAK